MTTTRNPAHPNGIRSHRPRRATLAVLVPLAGLISAATAHAASGTAPAAPLPAPAHSAPAHAQEHAISSADRVAAMLATAGFQDVATAEASGYASSIDSLGCFQNPAAGGMGVHYIDERLLDATVDVKKPEALVYELGSGGTPVGLVAHEYIVPTSAWTASTPPRLFGTDFHRHPVLPLWVLHAWLWKDNPAGVSADWNPAVRLCPAGVPIFGKDRPVQTTRS